MMARTAQFGVFPVFRGLDGRLAVQPEMIFPTEDDAKRAAKIFAGVLGGAVAFKRMADQEAGTVEKGTIIAKYGVMADTSADERAETRSFAPSPEAA
jgi:hypothetical protein